MKIDTNSWHYKYVAVFWDHKPTNLCWYFWKVVLTLAMLLAGGSLAVLGALVTAGYLTFPVWQFYYDGYLFDVAILSSIAWLTATYVVIATLRNRRIAFYRRNTPPQELKPGGLLRSYWRAVKDKVCPFIEYD